MSEESESVAAVAGSDNISEPTMWSKVEEEYNTIVNNNTWQEHFLSIKEECEKYKLSYDEALKKKNVHFNRYVDVYPFDHSRVVLKRGGDDYINANIVKMEKANRKYILTQGPLASTINHFWLMVWEQDCRAILMLNKILEKDQVKCHWYWPYNIGSEYALTLGNGLKIEQTSAENYPHFITRLLKVTDLETNESRDVTQFHYKTWPDFGVPSSPNEFLDFLIRVRESGALDPNVGPPVVHCSAGIGRSGTFCLVDSCLVLIENNDLEGTTVKDILLEMRKDRMGLVQTAFQLRFSYDAIIEGAKRLFDPDYVNENIDYKEVVEDEESPPPLPPRRIESLRNNVVKIADQNNDKSSKPSQLTNGNKVHSEEDEDEDSDDEDELEEVEEEKSIETTRLLPPNKDLPEAPSSESEVDNDASIESPEKSTGIRQRTAAQAALNEKVQQMKRKQREAENWNQMKRSLYKPMTITFGIIVCGAIFYMYMKN